MVTEMEMIIRLLSICFIDVKYKGTITKAAATATAAAIEKVTVYRKIV